MAVDNDRRAQLQRGLRGLDQGSALLATHLGIERDGVVETFSQVNLNANLVEVAQELPAASDRIRAASVAQERPQLAPLDEFVSTPEPESGFSGLDLDD